MRKRRESSSSKLLKIKTVRKIVAGARAEDVCPPLPQPIPSGADSPSQSPKGRGGFSAGDDGSLSPGPLNLQHTFSTLGSGLPGPSKRIKFTTLSSRMNAKKISRDFIFSLSLVRS